MKTGTFVKKVAPYVNRQVRMERSSYLSLKLTNCLQNAYIYSLPYYRFLCSPCFCPVSEEGFQALRNPLRLPSLPTQSTVGSKGHQTMAVETTILPPEVIAEILTWVPTKPLVRFRCISKHYQTLLTSKSFVKKHLSRASQNDENHSFIFQTRCLNDKQHYLLSNGALKEAVELDSSYIRNNALVVGSSNGLICLSHKHNSNYGSVISLWNPLINKYKRIQRPEIQIQLPVGRTKDNLVTLGFAFHPTINEYKVVRFVEFEERGNEDCTDYHSKVEVYSLSTDSWSSLGDIPYRPTMTTSVAMMNGVIHWTSRRENTLVSRCENMYYENHHALILAFDMAEEKFLEVPVPDSLERVDVGEVFLREFRGYLSMFVGVAGKGNELWIMTNYGVKESWTHMFTVAYIPCPNYPVDILKNGDIFLREMYCRMHKDVLFSYNSNSNTFMRIQIRGLEKEVQKDAVVPYVESLALLGDDQVAD